MKVNLHFLAGLATLLLAFTGAVTNVQAMSAAQTDDESSSTVYYRKLVTDESQITSNNPSVGEGDNYGYIIDDDPITFWTSNYGNNTAIGEVGDHYLEFTLSEALGDSVLFSYVVRQGDSYINSPTDFVIMGSMDGSTYDEIRHFTKTADNLIVSTTTTPYTAVLYNTTGYTSLRMVVSASSLGGTYNGHAYFSIAEVQFSAIETVAASWTLDATNYLVTSPAKLKVTNIASGDITNLVNGDFTDAGVTTTADAAEQTYVRAYRAAGFTTAAAIAWAEGNSGANKITKAEVYASNDTTEWTLIGTYTPQTDASTGLQYVLADMGANYKYVKLVPLTTTAEEAPTGSPAIAIAEFNIVPAIQISDMPLQELVDSYEYGVDDYAYGTDPGMVSDYTIYENFYNAYTDALVMLSSSTATDADKLEMSRKLQLYKAQAENSINVPEADKYYYIQSAYNVFANIEKTVGWYAPRTGIQPGWRTAQKTLSDAWILEEQSDGSYAIKNAATGTYIDRNQTVDGTDSPLEMSTDFKTAQVITNIGYTGQFTIRPSVGTRFYNTQEANSGAADDGPIANWTSNTLNSEGAWYIREISAEDLATIQTTANHDRLLALANSFDESSYTVGTDPGQYSKTLIDAAKTAVATAKTMLSDGNTYTEEQYAAAYETLKTAVDNANNGQNEVETGYYVITDKDWSDIEADKPSAAWTTVEDQDYIESMCFEEGNPAFIWKITKLESGNYSVQNIADERYASTTDYMVQAAAISVTKTHTVDQTFTMDKETGRFEISNTITLDNGFIYHSGRATTSREAIYLVYESNHVTWYLHRYTDAEVDSINTAYPQQLRTDSLNELITEVSTKVNQAYEYEFDYDNPLITDAGQFYCNNKSQEGSYDALIDNNYDTHFSSAYNSAVDPSAEDAYHYLRMDAGEGKTFPEKFGLYWRARNTLWLEQYRPVEVSYAASDDAVTWVELGSESNPSAGFTTTADQPDYYSKNAINTIRGYRYFKITFIRTNNMQLDPYGHPFVQMSEFNMYPTKGIKDSSPAYDTDVQAALQVIEPLLTSALEKVEANNATSEDIATLQAAYNELLLVWKDTSDLYTVYTKANTYNTGVTAGFEEMFTFPDEQVEAFQDALYAVEDARPWEDLTQRQVAALDTALTNAFAALKASMYTPDPDKWYYIKCKDNTSTDSDGTPIKDKYAWIGGNTSVDGTGCGTYTDETILTISRAAWKFEPTGTPGQFKILNCGSGYYMEKGNVFEVTPLGDGQIGLQTVYNEQYYYIVKASLPGVPFGVITPVKDGQGSWAVEEVVEEQTQTVSLQQGRVWGRVLPFDTYSMPIGTNGEPVGAYKICGYQTTSDGKQVSAINLTANYDDDIPAATPFIIIVEPDEAYNSDSIVKVDYCAKVHGNVSQETAPVNGLFGTFTLYSFAEGQIYLQKDSAYVKSAGYSINPQGAYIDVNSITNDSEASVDKIVYVSGVAELLNGVNAVILDAKKPVNVYTIDGVLLRKNVLPTEATKGLAPGIYIVGKNKVLVK